MASISTTLTTTHFKDRKEYLFYLRTDDMEVFNETKKSKYSEYLPPLKYGWIRGLDFEDHCSDSLRSEYVATIRLTDTKGVYL